MAVTRRDSARLTPSSLDRGPARVSPCTAPVPVPDRPWDAVPAHCSPAVPATFLDVTAFCHLLPWTLRRRISSGCSQTTNGRPRSCSCSGKPWRRWRPGSTRRSRRWTLGTRASRGCWSYCRDKVKGPGVEDRGLASLPWQHRKLKHTRRTCM